MNKKYDICGDRIQTQALCDYVPASGEVLNKLFSLFFINMILSLIKQCLINDTRVLGSLLKGN